MSERPVKRFRITGKSTAGKRAAEFLGEPPLTLICGGVAQTCHDDRVVELKEQLGIEEEDGEGQEGKVKEEGRDRVKENAPWMTMEMTM